MACVIEDDVQLLPTFLDILNYEKLSKKNWGILLLTHHSQITRILIEDYCKSFVNPPEQKIAIDSILYWQSMIGSITKSSYIKYTKDHYIARPYQIKEAVPASTMAYFD